MPETKTLSAGMPAPDFTLSARSGRTISLRDFRGKKNVLVFFYPKDDTPGCTKEACSLRDGWSRIQAAGIEVLGISRDDAVSHNAFASKFNLPFELLTDADHAVHEKYGAWGEKTWPAPSIGVLRKSFLIGKNGNIRHVFNKVDVEHHAEEVLKAMDSSNPPGSGSNQPPAPPAPAAPKPAAPAAPAPAAAPPAPAPRPAMPAVPRPAMPAPPKPPAPPAPAAKPVAPAAPAAKKAAPKKKAAKKKAAPKKKAAKKAKKAARRPAKKSKKTARKKSAKKRGGRKSGARKRRK